MPSPQELLNQIHALSLQKIWAIDISDNERKANIKLAKQQLKQIKQSLKSEQATIKSNWDGRNNYEAEREKNELKPYVLIEQLIGSIETSFIEIENAIQFKRPLPEIIVFGDTIGGGEAEGYIISSQVGVEIFKAKYVLSQYQMVRQDAVLNRQRAQKLGKEYKEKILSLKEEINILQSKTQTPLIKAISLFVNLCGLVFLVGLGVAGFVILFKSDIPTTTSIGFPAVIVGGIAGMTGLIISLLGLRGYRQAKKSLVEQTTLLSQAKNEYDKIKNLFEKVQKDIKELEAHINNSLERLTILESTKQ